MGTYNGDNHSHSTLSSNKDRRTHQNQDCHGNSCQCEGKLGILSTRHDDHELDRKTEEEEKVEFKQRDVDLR